LEIHIHKICDGHEEKNLAEFGVQKLAKMSKVRKKKSSWSEMNEGAREAQGLWQM